PVLPTPLPSPPFPYTTLFRSVEPGCRSVDNEVPLPGRSSVRLAHLLVGGGPTPSQNLRDQELTHQLQQAMAGLSREDREVLLLRDRKSTRLNSSHRTISYAVF